jgi:superoxide reductase
MERREVLKSIGLLSLTGAIGMISACNEPELKENKEEKAEKKTLEESKPGMNRQKMAIEDTENPTKAELKHTPEIAVKESDDSGFTRIDITVGSQGIIHPTKAEHWIDFMKLYLDNDLIGEINFEAGKARGFGSFYVKTEGVQKIKAEIGCNLHGIWENTLEI